MLIGATCACWSGRVQRRFEHDGEGASAPETTTAARQYRKRLRVRKGGLGACSHRRLGGEAAELEVDRVIGEEEENASVSSRRSDVVEERRAVLGALGSVKKTRRRRKMRRSCWAS